MKTKQYESPIKALLESLQTNFANTVNPKGSLEIEQIVVDGFTASQETVNASQLPKHEVAMAMHHLSENNGDKERDDIDILAALAWLREAQEIMTPELQKGKQWK